jgi:hypothetical protein
MDFGGTRGNSIGNLLLLKFMEIFLPLLKKLNGGKI